MLIGEVRIVWGVPEKNEAVSTRTDEPLHLVTLYLAAKEEGTEGGV